jgi:putative ABC transport system permease protein
VRITDLLIRSVDSLSSARSRTVFTTLSIGVAAFSLAMAISINNGGSSFIQRVIDAQTEPQTLWVMKKQDEHGSTSLPSKYTGNTPMVFNSIDVRPLDKDDLENIRNTAEVESAKPYLVISDAIVTRRDQPKYQAVVTEKRTNDTSSLLAGSTDDLKDEEVILPDGYRQVLQYSTPEEAVGTTITVMARSIGGLKITTKEFNLKVRAVVKEPVAMTMQTYLRVTENLVEQMNQFSTKNTPMQDKYIAATAKVASAEALDKAKQNLIDKGYVAQTKFDRDSGLTSFVYVFQSVLILFGLLSVLTAVFGIINTQYMSVLQRVHIIGLMKALGMQKRDVAMLFRIEAAFIGFSGATVGVLLMFAVSSILNPLFIRVANLDADMLILKSSGFELAGIILGLTLIATVAGLVPARKASQLDPIEALRNESE